MDLVLVQDAVLLARRQRSEPLLPNVTYHVVDTELRIRGVRADELREGVRLISDADFVALMLDGARRVIGVL